MTSLIRTSIIIPAYNEEKTILEVLEKVRAQSVPGVEFEVIVIDDGSKDRTAALLKERPELYDIAIFQPQNGGKGAAVKAGLSKATGDYVLFQDADLEYDPGDYAKIFYPVTAFGADVVIGSRLLAPTWIRVYYFWHKVGNGIITGLFNVLYNATFTDIYSCYLAYRRELVDAEKLTSLGWEQHAEILCTAVKASKVYYEVPVTYHGRSYEEGKKIRAIHSLPVLAMIIKKRFTR